MALILNPINDPDDIRAEASKVPVYGGAAEAQQLASTDPAFAATVAATPNTSAPTPVSEPVTSTPAVAPAQPEARPYQTFNNSGAIIPTSTDFGADEINHGYTYMVPAGIYVIVALSAAAALLCWVMIIFFNVHRMIPIIEASVVTVFGVGLLSRSAIVRYGAIAASGIGAAYMAYQSFRFMQFASSSAGTIMDSFGLSSYTTGVIVIYLAVTISLAVCCGYLITARVGRAFR